MCIALVTTQHPDYPLILLNNRDEFLHRPTLRASWWDSPDTAHIFSGRDLARPERGTWLGITRQGRLAVLTNFRESSSAAAIGTRSRGAMVNSFLTQPTDEMTSTKDWVHHALTADGDEGINGVGGFSLICGNLRAQQKKAKAADGSVVSVEPLAVISNRTTSNDEAHWICGSPGEVHALSNSLFDDASPWPKVTLGKDLLEKAIKLAVEQHFSKNELITSLFSVLSHNTYPDLPGEHDYQSDLESLRHSIFIPAFVAHEERPSAADNRHKRAPAASTNGVEAVDDSAFCEDSGTPIPKPVATNLMPGTAAYAHQLEGYCATPTDPHHHLAEIPAEQPAHPDVEYGSPRVYGTQKQTVILVHKTGHVTYIERTLYDENANWHGDADEEAKDVVCEFQIENW